MSGKLAENIEIIAALTDEATPIQPEGNTQTLKEIDKVFVNFKTPYIQGTVGDFNLDYSKSHFGNVKRKLQGLTLLGDYKKQMAGATIATSRGFFNHISMIGKEGTQGPYELTGKNGEKDIIVLAGTERIWLNGELLTRGASNDYIIEYGNGQVAFTHKWLITSETRIEVDFEYFPANQKFSRNVYSAINGLNFMDGTLLLNTRYYQEKDDPDQLLEQDGEMSAEEKQIIADAGDNPVKAVTRGAVYVGDSLGSYVKIDTLIEGQVDSLYRFKGKKLGDYIVRFSFVGNGKGDYTRDRIGTYRFIGIGKGSYLPVKLLPIPLKHEMVDFQLQWQPLDRVKIETEYALSRLDKNLLSAKDDLDNSGNALFIRTEIDKIDIDAGGYNFGRFGLGFNGKYIEKDFQGVDRLIIPDYLRYWNLSTQDRGDNYEKSFSASLHYIPFKSLTLKGNAGNIEKTLAKSQRYAANLQFDNDNWFKSELNYENIHSDRGAIESDWQRTYGSIQRAIYYFKPRLIYNTETRKIKESSRLSGFQFDEYGADLGLINWKYLDGNILFKRREDRVYDPQNDNRLIPQARSDTKELNLALTNVSQTQLSLHLIQRNKDYTKEFENVKVDSLKLLYLDMLQQDTSYQDRSTNLAELNFSHARWNKVLNVKLQYRVSTENTALKEKIYLDVGQGNGNFRYDKELEQYVPDADGNYILYILPSGKFEPVTNLQTSLRLILDPYNYWKRPKNGMEKLFRHISSETFIRIEEESKEADVSSIYLLNLSKFQGVNTIRGILRFNEDLYIAKRNRDLSLRLRYRYNESLLNQYLDAVDNQKNISKESGIRLSWRPVKALRNQTEIRLKNLFRENKASVSRNRDIVSYFLNQRLSWRFKKEYFHQDISS